MNIGRYEVIHELGRGGMAIVYLARDPLIKRQVAVKVLPRQFTFDPQFRTRFQREAEVIASLEHPFIVPVHDFGEHDGQPFIVMRYMPGGTLADRLSQGSLPLPEIAGILERIGSAIDYAHSRGVVHRDIKPGNILFDAQEVAHLSDFGIAKLVESSAAFTGTALIGTPEYMSPEQARGEKGLDGRSDIYSLGVLLFQALCGQLPFKADTPMGMAVAHLNEPVPSLLAKRPDLPPGYETVVRRTLEKDPAKRYPTASELAHTVSELAANLDRKPINELPTIKEPAVNAGLDQKSEPIVPAIRAGNSQPANATRMNTPPFPVERPRFNRQSAVILGVLGALLLCLCLAAAGAFLSGLIPNPFAVAGRPTPSLTATEASAAPAPTEAPVLPASGNGAPAATAFSPVGLRTTYIEYILDASGSMLETLEGKTRLQIAQDVLISRLKTLPPDTQVGLRVYGHRIPYPQEEESCQDIELVVPIQTGGAEKIIAWLPSMQALGMTPMSESIRQAAADFTFEPGLKNFIVLISDGEETCGEEPAEVVKYLQEIGIDFTIHVIGLNVNAQTAAQLRRIADTAGGVYHDAKSQSDLEEALNNIQERMLPVNPPATEVAQVPTSEATQAPTEPQPTATRVPEPNAEIASEGAVEASTTYDANFVAALSVDGDPRTSWFSAGPGADSTTVYQWTGQQDDFIARIEIVSNREHLVVDFRDGYGFGAVIIQVLDAGGSVVFEESAELPGTPDPEVVVFPNVTGRSIRLIFSGHEDPGCGGFAELKIGAVR
jgi:serine/threonine protein kinase